MKIQEVTLHEFQLPLSEPFVTALRPIPELERVLVEVTTDTGLTGLGEAAPSYEVTGESQRSTVAILEDVLAPLLVGRNPLAINTLTKELKDVVDGAPSAHAAVEMALQDLRGKNAGVPLYELWGGDPAESVSITVPKVISLKDPDEMASDASDAVASGYDRFKIKVGGDPQTDIERIRSVREAIPTHVSLKADANQGWKDAKTALSVLRHTQSDINVIEQPVADDNVDDLSFLRSRLDIPVMPDESVKTASDASKLVKMEAGDVYNIKLMKAGGLNEAIRINTVAEADNRPTQLGSMVEGHVGTAAGAHFVAAFENVIWNEMVGPFMTEDGITDLQVAEPRIEVDGPGLGVTIDHDRLEQLATNQTIISSQK
ncbi:L-alanine-DL-glutamate epimerase [Halogranum amylolyticum]|uniref:L-alanine-DL-glutamate epimerase n=1 Tax=Halogranum amylolyticum TaxID=660520 RepID=A0A1H8WBS2_9EURY|nr:dipeptide epimerase [Halogranum amylolyticum]SEP24887.1 L-alanine-DL-glutamate epimerase [Halogranum amylolyticum]